MKVFIQNNIYEKCIIQKKKQMQYQYITIIIQVILNEIIEWMYQKVIK